MSTKPNRLWGSFGPESTGSLITPGSAHVIVLFAPVDAATMSSPSRLAAGPCCPWERLACRLPRISPMACRLPRARQHNGETWKHASPP